MAQNGFKGLKLLRNNMMDIYRFNIIGRLGKKQSMLYDPYLHIIYSEKLENHFKHFRNNKHPIQTGSSFSFNEDKDSVIKYIGLSNHHIVLDLTEQCNFRCKYCIYQDEYENRREYSKNIMSKSVLKQTVKFYNELIKLNNTKEEIIVGLYGGEPSLEPLLVKEAIFKFNHALTNKKHRFNFITNGTLSLDSDLIAFLKKNNVNLIVSLDGPKQENDRFRVLQDKNGTFDLANKCIESFSDYGLNIQATVHPEHNWDELNKFFTELLNKNSKVQLLVNFMVPPERSSKKSIELTELMINKLTDFQTKIKYKLKSNIKLTPFEYSILQKKLSKGFDFKFSPIGRRNNFNNSCYPGQDRLMVNTKGEIFICEEVSDYFKIGNVYKGLDVNRITWFWKEADRISEQLKCKSCFCHQLCNKCFANLTTDKQNQLHFSCDSERVKQLGKLIEFYGQIQYGLGVFNE